MRLEKLRRQQYLTTWDRLALRKCSRTTIALTARSHDQFLVSTYPTRLS